MSGLTAELRQSITLSTAQVVFLGRLSENQYLRPQDLDITSSCLANGLNYGPQRVPDTFVALEQRENGTESCGESSRSAYGINE